MNTKSISITDSVIQKVKVDCLKSANMKMQRDRWEAREFKFESE